MCFMAIIIKFMGVYGFSRQKLTQSVEREMGPDNVHSFGPIAGLQLKKYHKVEYVRARVPS